MLFVARWEMKKRHAGVYGFSKFMPSTYSFFHAAMGGSEPSDAIHTINTRLTAV